ncbi:hypothetical protein DENSPDRAFT_846104 [Dentipellis sp. KUC8613]|nr:hypothetical protein DENSPDRAFT_846104 [Dentipellis sp. KUC8613]
MPSAPSARHQRPPHAVDVLRTPSTSSARRRRPLHALHHLRTPSARRPLPPHALCAVCALLMPSAFRNLVLSRVHASINPHSNGRREGVDSSGRYVS